MAILEDVKNFIAKFNEFNNIKSNEEKLTGITKLLVNLPDGQNQGAIFSDTEIKSMAEIIQDFVNVKKVNNEIPLDELKDKTVKFISEVEALNYEEINKLTTTINRFNNTASMLLMRGTNAPAMRQELLMFSNLNYFVEMHRIHLFDKKHSGNNQSFLSSPRTTIASVPAKVPYEKYKAVYDENTELQARIKELEAQFREFKIASALTNQK